MAKFGRLIYDAGDGKETTILWFPMAGGTPTFVDFCGTADPLTVSWKGDRYGVTFASSATIRLLVETLAQRQFLETIFNGGYEVTVRKDGDLFWRGKITPTLGIGSYSTYPYELYLNANDGIADAKKNKLLLIDYPNPIKAATAPSFIMFLGKLINNTLYPNSSYKLYVANIIYRDGVLDRVLDNTFLDPLCFMDETDNYLPIADILNSLLGPFNLRLYQWQGNWFLVSQDAAWDNGLVVFERYNVTTGNPSYEAKESLPLGIVDLYSCSFDTDYEIGSSTQIEFLPPWLGADINQQFQMNYNIFPAFTNRSGNFYSGHDGVELELLPTPIAQRLKYWTKDGLIVDAYAGEPNEGSLMVPVTVTADERSESATVSFQVDPQLDFNKFFFSCNTTAVDKTTGQPIKNDQIGIKKVFNITYEDTVNSSGAGKWYLWRNNPGAVNDPGAHDGWEATAQNYVFDHEDVSVEGKMPDGSMFEGGKFTFRIHNGYDANFNETNGYAYYLSNFKFGIVSSVFEKIPPRSEAKKKFFKREWVPIVGELLLSPMPLGLFTGRALIMGGRSEARDKSIGGLREDRFKSSDIKWDNSIRVDIVPNGTTVKAFEYRWGIHYPGLISHHELHISAPLDAGFEPVDLWRSNDQVTTRLPTTLDKDLMQHKAEILVRDNSEYTTKLVGRWISPKISPFQLVHDLEGRIYNFAGGQWNDKTGAWDADYIEFKGLNGSTVPPPVGVEYQLTVGSLVETSAINAGFWYDAGGATGKVGDITPTQLGGVSIWHFNTITKNTLRISVGLGHQYLLSGVSAIRVTLTTIGKQIILTPQFDHYEGQTTGLRSWMLSEVGNTLNIKVELL